MIELVTRIIPVATCLVLLACASGTSTGRATPAAPRLHSDATTVPGEYVVTLAPEVGEAFIRAIFGKFGIQRVQSLGRNAFLVGFQPDPGIDALQKARAGESRVTGIQPNYIYKAQPM